MILKSFPGAVLSAPPPLAKANTPPANAPETGASVAQVHGSLYRSMLRRNVLALNENMHDRDLTVPVPAGHNKVFVHQRWSAMLAKLRAYWQTGQTGWLAVIKSTSLAYTTSTRFSFNCRAQSWRLRRNRLLNSGCCSLINRVFKEQSADFACGADPANSPGLP